jgi:hypothetical protein
MPGLSGSDAIRGASARQIRLNLTAVEGKLDIAASREKDFVGLIPYP